MKRALLVLTLPFLLVGCAQVFDANIFSSVDRPPALNKSELGKKSSSELNQLTQNPGFYDQLKKDPEALATVQSSLQSEIDNATTASAKVNAASTLITLTANGSGVSELSKNGLNNITSVKDALSESPVDFIKVIKIFLKGQSESEAKASLDNLVIMAGALKTMQTAATMPDDTVNSTVFFSGTTDPLSFSQSSLMAAIGKALVVDSVSPGPGNTAAAAALLIQDAPVFPSSVELTAFRKAYNATSASLVKVSDPLYKPTDYSYAYVTTVKTKLPY